MTPERVLELVEEYGDARAVLATVIASEASADARDNRRMLANAARARLLDAIGQLRGEEVRGAGPDTESA